MAGADLHVGPSQIEMSGPMLSEKSSTVPSAPCDEIASTDLDPTTGAREVQLALNLADRLLEPVVTLRAIEFVNLVIEGAVHRPTSS